MMMEPEMGNDTALVHIALANPLILSNIFQHLSLAQLKEIRTICNDWELPAASHLGKETKLNIKSVCDDYNRVGFFSRILRALGARSPEMATMTVQLVRRITVESMAPNSLDKVAFQMFLRVHREWIQEFWFSVDWGFGPTMKTIFEDLIFPKVKKISILESGMVPGAVLQLPKFPLMPKMTDLELDSAAGEKANDLETGHRYAPMFQELIKKSPNLERLKITGNMYPDLSSAKKLKSLNLTTYPVRLTEIPDPEDEDFDGIEGVIRPDFSVQGLQQMLGQVSDSVEDLVIIATSQAHDERHEFDALKLNTLARSNPARYWKLPRLPKLTSLTIKNLNGFDKELSFTQDGLPSLTKLVLVPSFQGRSETLDNCLRAMGRQTSVEEFKFNFVMNEWRAHLQTLQILVNNFPNLKRLDFMTGFGTKLDCFGELGRLQSLENLKIALLGGFVLSEVMEEIGKADFKGLKSLHLIAAWSAAVRDDGCNNFQGVFESIPKIIFEGFLFRMSTAKAMLQFFEPSQRNERIQFIN